MVAGFYSAGACFSESALHLLGLMARVAGWSPDQFWQSTPADVAAVLGGWSDEGDDAGVDGAMLGGLMEQFPDG